MNGRRQSLAACLVAYNWKLSHTIVHGRVARRHFAMFQRHNCAQVLPCAVLARSAAAETAAVVFFCALSSSSTYVLFYD